MYIFMIFSPVPSSWKCCPENGIYRISAVRANSKRMSSLERGQQMKHDKSNWQVCKTLPTAKQIGNKFIILLPKNDDPRVKRFDS